LCIRQYKRGEIDGEEIIINERIYAKIIPEPLSIIEK
jgi:hypothetical protein